MDIKMTRNILPKYQDFKLKESTIDKEDETKSNILHINNQIYEKPFCTYRLNQWHTNEEIFNILNKCNHVFSNDDFGCKPVWFTDEVIQKPRNGSVFLFDRRRVKNFKKDGFSWKRRKTGGANSVREDRMYLKINGVDCIYGCYSHSSIIPTFHRRCYWLLDKPDFVLVHYLQTPNTETGECFINLNISNLVMNSECSQESGLSTDELKLELKSMLWPYYLTQNFMTENFKIFTQNYENLKFKISYEKSEDFFKDFLAQLFENDKINLSTIRVNVMGQNLNDILTKLNDNQAQDLNSNKKEDTKSSISQVNRKKKPNIPSKDITINKKCVQLSLTSCFSNFEDNLFLMSDSMFKDEKSAKIEYKIIICGKEVKTKKLNQNVLECKLPNFDFVFENQSVVYKTMISLFENDSLFCEPIPFEIKKYEPIHVIKDSTSLKSRYKNQFLILEKFILISKIYQFNIADYYLPSDNQIDFEKNICNIIECLTKISQCENSTSLSLLRKKHEGKTLLHLCAESNFNSICESLQTSEIKSILNDEIDFESSDNNGNTPSISACQNQNDDLVLKICKWHFDECFKKETNQDITTWTWYSNFQNLIVECNKMKNLNLIENLSNYLIECKNKIENEFKIPVFDNNQPVRFELESIEQIKKQIIPFSEQSITSQDLNSLPSPNINAVIDENFSLIENLGDISSFLSDDTHFEINGPIDVDLNKLIDFNTNFSEQFTNKKVSTSTPTCRKDDDQDEKIKALADNIIAAMPYKIKSHRYSSSNLMQQKSQFFDFENSNQDFFVHRNSASFDESYDGGNFSTTDPRISLSSCYSSSTRSSLSPTASISYQYGNDLNFIKNFNNEQSLDDSPGDDSVCSSSFHIDCTPSTAEFCQYFHASSSSGYYKNAIEKGFSQLTLTDDEQRELYEAALVIQNAYRRYIMRKKKKVKLDTENALSNVTTNFVDQKIENKCLDEITQVYQSNSPVSSFTPDSLTNNSLYAQANFSNHDEYDENNSSGGEENRQYEAACVIQKYYRRYKQYENLHKYTEAAVKIQTRYRAYKSTSLGSSKFRTNSNVVNNFKNHYNHNSIDETTISDFTTPTCLPIDDQENYATDLQANNFNLNQLTNQKQVARKLINMRQSSRFSPASTPNIQPNKPNTSNLSRKFSSSSLNNTQFSNCASGYNDQNFGFYENNNSEVKFTESNSSSKSFTIETPVNFQEFCQPQDTFSFDAFNSHKDNEMTQNFTLTENQFLKRKNFKIKLDSLIDNKLIESSSTTTCIESTTNQTQLKQNLIDSNDSNGNTNNNSCLVQTRNRSKSKLLDNTSNKTSASSTSTSQPKKTIFSYLVERQQQLQQIQQQQLTNTPVLEQQQQSKIIQENKSEQFERKKNFRNKRQRRSQTETNRTKRQRGQKILNQPTESSIASSSSSSSQPKQNQSNPLHYLTDLYNSNNKEKIEQIFSYNSLFNSSQSLLTKLDLKLLFQPAIFESLPRQSQLKLIKLLPECDRQFDSHGSFKLSIGALNNEFIKKCCVEWQQKLANGNYDNLENSLQNTTTITRSTRLKQQKLLESLKSNENEQTQSDDETDEFFYYDEDEFIDPKQTEITTIQNEQNQNDKSIYESAEETETNSLNSSFNEDQLSETTTTSFNDEYFSPSTSDDDDDEEEDDQESFDEELETKRKQLQREAKRLLKKQEKLSSKLLNSDCMISTSDTPSSETVRKSQRKRTLSKKFTDDEYSLNEDELDQDEKCKLEVSLEDQKGELKLKIKRVSQSNLNKLNCLENDDFPTKRKRNNSSNFKTSLNNSPLSLFPELSMSICSPAVSPSAVSPSKIIIKQNSSPPVHLQAPPPPVALPLPPHNIFNDDDDEEIPKKEQTLPDSVKTLALLKTQIAEKKRKLSEETSSVKRTKSFDYNSNIQKIVSELKSIGSSNDNLSETLSPEDFINVQQPVVVEETKLEPRELPSFLVNLDLVDLIKIQQDREKKSFQSIKNNFIDTSFLTENLDDLQNCEVTLPNINTLIHKINTPLIKPVKEQTNQFTSQFVSPMPPQYQQQQQQPAPNRVIQSPVYQNGYQNRQNFVTSSPNYPQKQPPQNFQYPRYPPSNQIQPQFVQQQQMPQPQQFNQQYQYNQFQQQPSQPPPPTQQVYNQQNVVLVQSPIKYQPPPPPQPQQTPTPQVYNGQVMKPQMTSPQPQMQQINLQQPSQTINVSIPQPVSNNQTLVNSMISPINSQNSQSSPSVQPVTPTKTKRKTEKEKPTTLTVNTTTPCTTPSQVSSNSVNNQIQNQSRSSRSTQHQLTVAQLLSQKHQQQQKEINRTLTSPLTIPSVIQVNEPPQVQSPQIIIPASLTSQPIKLPEPEVKQNQFKNLNPSPQPAQPKFNSTLSIPTSLSQSAKIILNNEPAQSPAPTVTCIPITSLNFNQSPVLLDSQVIENKKESTDESTLSDHECTKKKAMIECEKCSNFCHDDCIYYKNIDNRQIKVCSNCFNETNEKKD